MIPLAYEIHFEGLVGQTHTYSGLSFGNEASMANRNRRSSPKEAALQGLEKMKLLYDLGISVGVFPPHERPHLPSLRALGFYGIDQSIPERVFEANPYLLFNYTSASPMWTANWAAFTPSVDTTDGKVHITPANMSSTGHRACEAQDTSRILKAIFPSYAYFTHHPPLPNGTLFTDEGSANHLRFCREYNEMGVHLFVYGITAFDKASPKPEKYPARQTLEASESLARSHKIFPERVIFAHQTPLAVDSGAFHNDLISMGDKHLFIYHENAFIDYEDVIEQIQEKVEKHCETSMQVIKISETQVSLSNAIHSYLFNSQLISLPDKQFSLIAPLECRKNPAVFEFLNNLAQQLDTPIRDIHYVNLTESMGNGGGPSCLTNRVVLTQNELNAVNPRCLFNELLYNRLKAWINKHYRDSLVLDDLRDPNLVNEVQAALQELTFILDLGLVYSFQYG